ISGNLDGAAGANSLDFSAATGPISVNLASNTATDIGGTFANIQTFKGSSSSDTLIGPDAANTWNIPSANAGTVAGNAFSSFENLIGGSGDDNFVFMPGGSISGNLDGGPGNDTLDYHNLSTPVVINLSNFTATGIGGTFSNIENVVAGSGS